MKKILLIMLMMVFLVAPVSAVAIDYTDNDMTAHVKDTILFGLINIGEQGTIELKSHSSVDEILGVGLGWQVTMYYDTNFGKAHQEALGDVTFIDMKTGLEVEKEWKYVYWGTETREEERCLEYQKDNNIYQTCINKEMVDFIYEGWLEYNSKDIPKGQIRIGIMVNNK